MVRLEYWRGTLCCAMVVVSGMIAGCGGSSSDSSATAADTASTAGSTTSTSTSTSTSSGLTISGTPAPSVVAGQAYAFRPAATAPSGATVQYSIAGRPAWATFNPTTGALTGTPTSADVGVNVGVQITASDGTTSAATPPFEITVNPTATASSSPASTLTPPATANSTVGNVTLGWAAPTENTNGTNLTNLGGYKIYYGTASKQYSTTVSVSSPATLSYVIDALTVGQTYYFAVTAVSAAGIESSYSPEISATIS
jgi:hypothetical protein